MTITIELDEAQASRLAAIALLAEVGVQDLVRRQVVELIERHPDATFDQAARYVLTKNAELYERLAK